MAHSLQARKRVRQAEKHRAHNASRRSRLRTLIKKTEARIREGDYDQAMIAYREAVPYIDRMSGRGLIHANKAARHKSRLNLKIKALQPTSE